ncbi:MAG: DUF547 domain-containing protein [Myxococcota bacterium]
MSTRTRIALIAAVTFLSAAALMTPRLLGFHTVPLPRGAQIPYALNDWRQTLATAVHPGGVDYATLREQRDPLLRFVKAMSTHGPKTAPDAFPTEPERLAYYLNAYNALVLYSVVVHQPPSSIRDVHGLFEPAPGFGFFYAQGFELDGERVNLYDLENSTIRSLGDARIHAAINCASASCPPLRSDPFHAARLDAELDAAARDWLSNGALRIAPDALELSAIFDWYAEDFETHARALGGEDTMDWIDHHLSGEAQLSFRAARSAGRPVRFLPYDWSLNRVPSGSATATTALHIWRAPTRGVPNDGT